MSGPPLQNIPYAVPAPRNNAHVLVTTTAILAIVSAIADVLFALGMGAISVFPLVGVDPGFIGREPVEPIPTAGDTRIGIAVVAAIAVVSMACAIVQFIAAAKLIKRGRNARRWGFASGIIGCLHLWCIWCAIIPISVGVFTIVVMCLGSVKRYLAERAMA